MLKISQPSVSKHLKVLEEAGLVRSSKEGLWVNYSVADGSDSTYAASLFRRSVAMVSWGAPGLVINNKIVSVGVVPDKKKIRQWLTEAKAKMG